MVFHCPEDGHGGEYQTCLVGAGRRRPAQPHLTLIIFRVKAEIEYVVDTDESGTLARY